MLLRGVNDRYAAELLRWCLERDYQLRIIEQMPLDAQHGWSRDGMVTAEEIFALLESEFELTPDPEHRGSAPAETFLVDGGPAKVGVIASVTRPFCGDCDRVRLTADGQVRNCLFAREESDLRRALRGDATDERDRRPVAPRHDDQAPRPRHRRRDLPPAHPPHVRHRRLSVAKPRLAEASRNRRRLSSPTGQFRLAAQCHGQFRLATSLSGRFGTGRPPT